MTREFSTYERIGYTVGKYGALKNWTSITGDDPREITLAEFREYLMSRFNVREVVENVEAMNNYFQLLDTVESLM